MPGRRDAGAGGRPGGPGDRAGAGGRGDVALFAHGHLLRVLAARWLGMPPDAGRHFLLDTGTLSVLGDYGGIPAVRSWNAPLG